MWRQPLMKLRLHTPGLAGQLAIVTGALVAVAVAAMYFTGIDSLRSLVAAEGITRVELGAAAARENLRQTTEDLLTTARIVAERPPLQRVLRDPVREALPPYLIRSCTSVALHACAIVRGTEVLATTTSAVDWTRVLTGAAEQGELFLVTGAMEDTAVAGASATIDEHPGTTVIALRGLDASLTARLSERAGVAVTIMDYESFRPGEGPFAVLYTDALSRGQIASAYIEALDAYAASIPIATATGETVALLQALLPAAQVTGALRTIESRIWLVAVLIAALATAASVLIGRYWISAVARLTEAARRLGAGDLTTSFPTGGGKELQILGTTMEEMRRNLVALTAELRHREADAQAVLGGIIEGVYAVDEARRIRFLNPQAERLLNVTAADATGKFCGDVLSPRPGPDGRRPCEHSCPILEARRAGKASATEQILSTRDGSLRRVVIASAAPTDAEQLQVQVLRDETELEAVRQTRDTVLANISHEFRTPLAAQLASIELLREGVGTMPASSQRDLVMSLQRSTQRLTWLIDNLLESVRIEARQLGLRQQDVAIPDIMVAARELVEPLIEQRGQKLHVVIADDVPVVRGDEQRLTQVMVNLFANASKFGPGGSTIYVRGHATSEGGVEIYVEDEGPGPRDASDANLFDRFHRAAGDKDPDESGLGLGLYIVRSIVTRHGGTVRLTRTAESRTRASVVLPAAAQT